MAILVKSLSDVRCGALLLIGGLLTAQPICAEVPATTLPTGETVASLLAQAEIRSEARDSVPLESGYAGWPSWETATLPRWPRISSGIGLRRDPLGHKGVRLHSGLDLPSAAGTPVKATLPGRVSFEGWAGGYGQMVELDHGNGIVTRYAHLSRILVGGGQRVEAGMVIGRVGSTGRSTGSHLHYELRVGGRPVDPLRQRITLPMPGRSQELSEAWLATSVAIAPRWNGWTDPHKTGELPHAIIE